MKCDNSRLRRSARLFSGVALLAGIAAPILSGTTAVSASSSLPAYGTLYVVNQSSDSITVIAPNGSTAATIFLPAGSRPTSISVSQDDTTAWVTDSGSDKVSEIDLTTNSVVKSFPLQSGETPTSASISGNGFLDVVETGTSNQVVGYSLPDFTLKGTYTPATGSTDTSLAQASDGSGFSVVETNGASNSVQFLDPTSFSTVSASAPLGTFKNFYISHGPAGYNYFVAEAGTSSDALVCAYETNQACPATFSSAVPLPFTPTAIASSPDGNSIVVVGKGLGGQNPSNQFDLITGVTSSSLVQHTGTSSGSSADSVAFSNDGSKFYIGDSTTNSVSEWSITGSSASLATTFNGITDPVAFATSYDIVPTPTFTTTLANPGGATTFDASATAQPTSPISSYSWDFGDGTTATTSKPTTSHTFTTPGQHLVTLTITDSAGSKSSSSQQYVGFLDPSRHALAYVTDTATNSVSVVDTQSNPVATIGAIPLVDDSTFCPPAYNGDCSLPTPNGIAASHDFSTVYVAASEGEAQGVVDVISTATNEVTSAIAIPATPLQIAVSADGTHLFVLTQASSGIATVDLTQSPPKVSLMDLPAGAVPADIAISPDGHHLGVVVDSSGSQLGQSSQSSGSLLEYSIPNDTISSTAPQIIPIATVAPNSLVMSNSSAFVAPSAYDSITNLYSFSSFDISSGKSNYTLPLTATGDRPSWISLSPDGTTLQMTVNNQINSSSYVAVRDASNGKTIQDVGMGGGSSNLVGIAYTPDGKATFSVDLGNDQVIDVDPYNLISKTSLDNEGPGITTSIDPYYDVVGQAPAPVPVPTTPTTQASSTTTTTQASSTTTTTQPSTTTTLATTISQPSSPPTTSVLQPSSVTQPTIIVPAVHTGRPWSSNLWWMLVASMGLVGVIVLRSSSRRRVVKGDES